MKAREYPLLGLSGKKRSGKDTFADRLVTEHGYTRVAFADVMKEAALALDPIMWTDNLPDQFGEPGYVRLSEVVSSLGWEAAKGRNEVRRTLQRLGTEMGRKLFGESFWVDQAMLKVEAIDGPVVITDVRFPNEADAVVEAGGVALRIERPSIVSTDTHPSETALDDYDNFALVVPNLSTLAALHAQADFIHGLATAPASS